MPFEHQTDWIQIRPGVLSELKVYFLKQNGTQADPDRQCFKKDKSGDNGQHKKVFL